jgi:UPF0716 protein FxsA
MIRGVPLLPLLVALFVVVPLVELYLIIQVGQAIGALPTIGVLVLDSLLGSLLMRAQGRAVWRRFNEAIAAGRPPAREVLDGAFVLVGGALLLTPGFATDVLGVLLLLPPTRRVLQQLALRAGLRRVRVATPGRATTYDGTAREVER